MKLLLYDALYSVGVVYYNRGDHQTALEWAERAISVDHTLKPAYDLLGNSFLGLDKYKDALAAFALADESNLLTRFQIGFACEKLERWEEAEEHYRAVLEKDLAYMTRRSFVAVYHQDPFSAHVHHALARVLQRQNKIEEAMLLYHLAKRIDPTIPLDSMYLEIMKESDLENHPSEKVLNKIHKPSAEAESVEKLKYLHTLSEYPTLREVIREYKSEDFISFIKDMIYAFQSNGDFYISALDRVIFDLLDGKEQADLFAALQTPSFKRLFELAELVHAEKMSLEEAIKLEDLEFNWECSYLLTDLTDRFIGIEPKTGFILAHLVEQLLSQSPDKNDAGYGQIVLGHAYYYTRKLDKAANAFNKAYELFREDNPEGMLDSLDGLCDVKMNKGNFPDALKTFDKYIQLAESQGKNEEVIFARYNRVRALFFAGRAAESYEEGLKLAFMVLDNDAIDDDFRDNLLEVLSHTSEKTGKSVPNDVIKSLSSEISSERESVKTLRSKAKIAEEKGDLDKALSLLEKARIIGEKRRIDLIKVDTDMGLLLSKIGRLTEAIDRLKIALSIAEPISVEADVWTILLNLGNLADRLGEKDEAITYLERALQEARQKHSYNQEGQCLLRLMQISNDVDPIKANEYLREIEKNFRDFLPSAKPHEEDLPIDWVEGMAAMKAGRFKEGIEALEHLCMDKSQDAERFYPAALTNCGKAYTQIGQIPEAINSWKKAVNAWLKLGNYDPAINVLGRMAHLLKQEGEDFTHIFKIWDGIEDPQAQSTIGAGLSEIAVNLGEYTRSEIISKKVLSIATSDEWRNMTDEMKARMTLGRIYRRTSRYNKALEQYEKALTIAQYLKDEPEEGIIRGWMGIVYRFLDELDVAVEQYERAININERYQNSASAAENRMNLASSLFLLGRKEEGKKTLLEALTAFDNEGLEEMASRVIVLLLDNFEMEEFPPDLQERIKKLIDENWKSSTPFIAGLIRTKQAKWLASQGDFENAQALMDEVIAMHRNNGDIFNQATSYLLRANILQDHDIIQAIADATSARDLAASIGQLRRVIECQEFLLFAALREGNEEQVNNYLGAVLEGRIQLRRRLKSDRDRMNFSVGIEKFARRCTAHFLQNGQNTRVFELQEWGRAQALIDLLTESINYSIMSDKKEVRDLLAKESEILTSMQNEAQMNIDESQHDENIELTSNKEAELAAVYEALEAYDPYYVLIKKGNPVNMARVQTLLSTFNRPAVIVTFGFVGDEIIAMTLRHDQMTPSVYRTGMDRVQVEAMLEAFNEEIHQNQGEGIRENWQDKGSPLLRGPSEDINENDLVVLVTGGDLQQIPIHALKLPNGQLLVEHASIVYTPSLTVLEALQMTDYEKPLRERTSLKGTYLFNWDEIPGNDNQRLIEFLNRQFGIELAKKVKIEKIDAGNTIRVSVEKEFLHLRLNYNKTKVSIEINDSILEELFVDVENGKLNVYKRSMFQALRMTDNEKVSRFICVGVTFPDEARAVSMRFGDIGQTISGNYLDKDKIKDIISNSSILHFACHGYFDPDHYLESGLVLRTMDELVQKPLQKEILSVRDIMTWHLDSELVVLSACETGRGTVAPSEFLGLSRGFLAAGAQSVIVALWKIENAATQAFMLTFYDNLQRQLKVSDVIDVADALRQTQCKYAKSYKLYDWAGFKLIGQPTIRWKGAKK